MDTSQTSTGSRLLRILNSRALFAFVLCLPLIVLMVGLILYPLAGAIQLSLLNKAETDFVGLDNFFYLATRPAFWTVFLQTVGFATLAVLSKAFIGFLGAQLLHILPNRGQRLWRGLLLMPWVIPPALGTLAWWWMFDSSGGAINAIITGLGGGRVPFLSETGWARFSVIVVDVWHGAPFFIIMFLAALKSVPAELHEAAKIDGATGWQRLFHVTIPVMRNVILITMLFSTIVTVASFDSVQVLTGGGPRGTTHLLGSYAFSVGILGGDMPLGAAISLYMMPVLALLAFFILRDVRRRTREQ